MGLRPSFSKRRAWASRRDVAGKAMVEGARVHGVQHGGGGPSPHSRRGPPARADPRGEDGTNHGRHLAPAHPAQDLQRIGQGRRRGRRWPRARQPPPCGPECRPWRRCRRPPTPPACRHRGRWHRAAAMVVLPMPISPSASTSAPPAMACMPKAMVAAQARSSSAASCVMSGVGRSRARSNTRRPASKLAQIWFTAAFPSVKAATICFVTAPG